MTETKDLLKDIKTCKSIVEDNCLQSYEIVVREWDNVDYYIILILSVSVDDNLNMNEVHKITEFKNIEDITVCSDWILIYPK